MPQSRLSVRVERKQAAPLYAALESIFEDDAYPLALLEIDGADPWQEISIYVEHETEVAPARARLVAALGENGVDIDPEVEVLPDIDWVAHSLEGLAPVRAGRFFIHGAHDRHRRRAGDIAIEIEAGMAFGTGHHGTTAGCLKTIERVVRAERPRRALDLGAGSAVLAIAIARMAHVPVLASDIDPVATRVAAENVRLNGVPSLVETITATGFEDPRFATRGPFDLIVANILARPLMQLAPRMARSVAPGGSVLLSGILARQRNAVLAAYVGQRFRHVRTIEREGWVTLHLKR